MWTVIVSEGAGVKYWTLISMRSGGVRPFFSTDLVNSLGNLKRCAKIVLGERIIERR